MFKNQKTMTVVALICALLSLPMAIVNIVLLGSTANRLLTIAEENEQLKSQVQALENGLQDSTPTAPNAGGITESYCHLLVEDWSGNPQTLTIGSALVQVTLIPDANGNVPTVESANLVFRMGVEQLDRKEVTLAEGESEHSYEVTMNAVIFSLPEMGEEDQVDLWLEVVLSNGQTLLSPASSWYRNGDNLYLLAG